MKAYQQTNWRRELEERLLPLRLALLLSRSGGEMEGVDAASGDEASLE